MCASRGCQGFVLMGCSPCVAAERANAAVLRHKEEIALFGEDGMDKLRESKGEDMDGCFNENVDYLMSELDIEDDALISILGNILVAD